MNLKPFDREVMSTFTETESALMFVALRRAMVRESTYCDATVNGLWRLCRAHVAGFNVTEHAVKKAVKRLRKLGVFGPAEWVMLGGQMRTRFAVHMRLADEGSVVILPEKAVSYATSRRRYIADSRVRAPSVTGTQPPDTGTQVVELTGTQPPRFSPVPNPPSPVPNPPELTGTLYDDHKSIEEVIREKEVIRLPPARSDDRAPCGAPSSEETDAGWTVSAELGETDLAPADDVANSRKRSLKVAAYIDDGSDAETFDRKSGGADSPGEVRTSSPRNVPLPPVTTAPTTPRIRAADLPRLVTAAATPPAWADTADSVGDALFSRELRAAFAAGLASLPVTAVSRLGEVVIPQPKRLANEEDVSHFMRAVLAQSAEFCPDDEPGLRKLRFVLGKGSGATVRALFKARISPVVWARWVLERWESVRPSKSKKRTLPPVAHFRIGRNAQSDLRQAGDLQTRVSSMGRQVLPPFDELASFRFRLRVARFDVGDGVNADVEHFDTVVRELFPRGFRTEARECAYRAHTLQLAVNSGIERRWFW